MISHILAMGSVLKFWKKLFMFVDLKINLIIMIVWFLEHAKNAHLSLK